MLAPLVLGSLVIGPQVKVSFEPHPGLQVSCAESEAASAADRVVTVAIKARPVPPVPSSPSLPLGRRSEAPASWESSLAHRAREPLPTVAPPRPVEPPPVVEEPEAEPTQEQKLRQALALACLSTTKMMVSDGWSLRWSDWRGCGVGDVRFPPAWRSDGAMFEIRGAAARTKLARRMWGGGVGGGGAAFSLRDRHWVRHVDEQVVFRTELGGQMVDRWQADAAPLRHDHDLVIPEDDVLCTSHVSVSETPLYRISNVTIARNYEVDAPQLPRVGFYVEVQHGAEDLDCRASDAGGTGSVRTETGIDDDEGWCTAAVHNSDAVSVSFKIVEEREGSISPMPVEHIVTEPRAQSRAEPASVDDVEAFNETLRKVVAAEDPPPWFGAVELTASWLNELSDMERLGRKHGATMWLGECLGLPEEIEALYDDVLSRMPALGARREYFDLLAEALALSAGAGCLVTQASKTSLWNQPPEQRQRAALLLARWSVSILSSPGSTEELIRRATRAAEVAARAMPEDGRVIFVHTLAIPVHEGQREWRAFYGDHPRTLQRAVALRAPLVLEGASSESQLLDRALNTHQCSVERLIQGDGDPTSSCE